MTTWINTIDNLRRVSVRISFAPRLSTVNQREQDKMKRDEEETHGHDFRFWHQLRG